MADDATTVVAGAETQGNQVETPQAAAPEPTLDMIPRARLNQEIAKRREAEAQAQQLLAMVQQSQVPQPSDPAPAAQPEISDDDRWVQNNVREVLKQEFAPTLAPLQKMAQRMEAESSFNQWAANFEVNNGFKLPADMMAEVKDTYLNRVVGSEYSGLPLDDVANFVLGQRQRNDLYARTSQASQQAQAAAQMPSPDPRAAVAVGSTVSQPAVSAKPVGPETWREQFASQSGTVDLDAFAANVFGDDDLI